MKVLDFAQDIDRSGQRFYQTLAGRTSHPGVQRIFRMLANDEKQLQQRLESIKARKGDVGKYDSVALAQSVNVFDQLLRQEERLEVANDLDAYQLAIDAEREVLELYERAAARESRPEVRHLLQEIAEGERKELEELESLYNFTNAPNEFLEWGEFSNLDEFHNFGRDVDV